MRGGGGVEEGHESVDFVRGSFDSNVPTSENVCHASTVLTSIGSVELSEMLIVSEFIGL